MGTSITLAKNTKDYSYVMLLNYSRWLTLMLSQEFPLPEVLRIWDSLLADESRSRFLIDVCAAMILLIRQDILANEFPENMKLLQNYPTSMDVHVILSKAASLSPNIISSENKR